MSKYRHGSTIIGRLSLLLPIMFERSFVINRYWWNRSQWEQEDVLAIKNHILGMLTQGESLFITLQHLAHMTNALYPGARCSILLRDETGRLRLGAAPSLPDFYNKVIDGLEIAPQVGSCGTAAYTGQRVIAEDILTHPYWVSFREIALRAGLRSCWSQPFIDSSNRVLGTFALYYAEPHRPSSEEIRLTHYLTNLAKIAIEFKKAQDEILLQASIFDNALAGIALTDTYHHIVRVNRAFTEITGFPAEDVVGKNPGILNSGLQDKSFYQKMWKTIRDRGCWRGEVWNCKKNGEFYAEILSISTIKNPQGDITHYLGIFTDITDIKHAQERLESLANFDPLTQLPNRLLLADRLRQSIACVQRENKLLAVGFMDLDKFKPINDQYGHDIGDRLLIEVAHRLNGAVRSGDTVARVGGDEFVLLLANLNDMGELYPVIDRILGVIAAPFRIQETDFHVTTSLGFTVYPLDDADQHNLLRHADLAMYEAKQAGRNCFHMFDTLLDQQQHIRHQKLERLPQTLNQNESIA
ncbi:hypothetical protein CCP3SC15_620012 [Gammaproteobacteria bacterium]